MSTVLRTSNPFARKLTDAAVVGLLATVIAVPSARGQHESAGPVSEFRAGAAHLGVYAVAGPAHYAGLKWRFQTEGPVVSTPAARGDTLFFGSADGRLYAVDASSGTEVWRFTTTGSVNSSPAVWRGTVLVQSSDGSIWSIDARNGALRWMISGGPDLPFPWGYESGDIYTSSPTVVGKSIVIGSGDGGVYRIDAATGRVQWRFQTGGRVRASPAVADSTVYVGSADGYFYALDLASGQLGWKYATEGTTLFSGDFGFDRRTIQSSAAVTGGTVFFGARDGFLYALDASTGELRWRFDHEISWVISSPAIADGTVFAASSDGRFIQAVDAATGTELWRHPTASSAWFSPVVAGELVFFGDAAGDVHAIDRHSGAYRWKERFSGSLHGSALVTSELLAFGSTDGGVYVVAADGVTPLVRAVFWDETLSQDSIFRGHEKVRDYLSETYEVLDARGLTEFLEKHTDDRQPSVVVFALDALPDAVTESGGRSLLRRYMTTGGRAVWLGEPPLVWGKDPSTGNYSVDRIDRARATELLAVDHDPGNFDRLGIQSTAAGLAIGLPAWGRGAWAVDASTVSTVLAYNEFGQAQQWVKVYGDSEVGAFVRLWGQRSEIPDLSVIRIAAELRPSR